MFVFLKAREIMAKLVTVLAVILSLVQFGENGEPVDVFLPEYQKPFFFLRDQKCWGYEPGCDKSNSFSQKIKCSHPEDVEVFYKEADFGYVAKRIATLETMCEPEVDDEADSSLLRCSEQLQYCQGKRLWLDFRQLPERKGVLRYATDVLKRGQIGGRCKFHDKRLKKQMIHMGPLQSWSSEMINFVSLDKLECDVTVDKPTFIMKIDAPVNMYHHFCDFFNLYASLHINGTLESLDNRDVNVLIWENLEYKSSVGEAFDAFTTNPIWNLNTFSGKRVCFNNVVFPLLPRMLYGLFYNTPLTPNDCQGSGLFKAFSDFVPHRMGIPGPAVTDSKKIRVTILARQTQHRRILNLGDLDKALADEGGYDVKAAYFTHNVPYREQMEVIRNTDILVGIHGAGLAHMLFLPDWAVVFELYDCDDPSCYKDLARLRGVKHITWTDKTKIYPTEPDPNHEAAAAKFTNYAFDPQEFARKIREAAAHVKAHPDFQKLDKSAPDHDEL